MSKKNKNSFIYYDNNDFLNIVDLYGFIILEVFI